MLFLCDHPEGDFLMVQDAHAAHDLQVLAGAASMTLACAAFKAAPSLIFLCAFARCGERVWAYDRCQKWQRSRQMGKSK